jgi:hypothetical protein
MIIPTTFGNCGMGPAFFFNQTVTTEPAATADGPYSGIRT